MLNNSMSWSGGSAPAAETRLSPRGAAQQTTTDTGMTFIGSVSNDITCIRDEVAKLQTAMECIRADLVAETRARSGDISSLRHQITIDVADQIAKMRKDIEGRVDGFEGQTTQWVHTLGQEIQSVKPRLDGLETTIPQHVTAQAVTEGRLAKMEQAIPAVHRSLTNIDEKHSSRSIELEGKLGAHRDQHGMEVRAMAANNAAEVKRLEEHLENLCHQHADTKSTLGVNLHAVEALNEKLSALEQTKAWEVRTLVANNAAEVKRLEELVDHLRQQEAMTKTTLGVNLQAVESLNEKFSTLQTVLQTKAGAADVESLEARVSTTLDKAIQSLGEELGRKESMATVKLLSDRVTGLAGDVQSNATKAQSNCDDLSKKVTDVDQSLSKMGKEAQAERERCNASLASLDRDLQTRAAKVDLDTKMQSAKADLEALQAKHISLEAAVNVPVEEVKKIHARTLVLEDAITTKANAAEIPRLQMQVAEHQAKHASHHAVGDEHAKRLEQTRSITTEHSTRLEVIEHRERDLQAQLTQKVEADSVKLQEMSSIMHREYYRREEVDAMMTRVWWRVGDASKSPKGMLPQLPHSVMR